VHRNCTHCPDTPLFTSKSVQINIPFYKHHFPDFPDVHLILSIYYILAVTVQMPFCSDQILHKLRPPNIQFCSYPVEILVRLGTIPFRYDSVKICLCQNTVRSNTILSIYRSVHIPFCPYTVLSIYRSVHIPFCPYTSGVYRNG